jgi:hypothetical protein
VTTRFRQARRLEATHRPSPRALSVAEHAMLLDKVAADRKALRWTSST